MERKDPPELMTDGRLSEEDQYLILNRIDVDFLDKHRLAGPFEIVRTKS
jgi:hypothetical protein